MKHSRFGLILFLTSGSLLACNGDPTSSIRDDNPPQILSDPAVIFLQQGGQSVAMTVELVDAQGNQLPADFDATPGGPQATVVRDTTFLQTTNGTNLNNSERFVVTSGAAGQTAITVTAGGATLDVPVNVLPTSLPAVFSSATPASDEIVNLSAPGYVFLAGTTVVVGADTAITLDLATDGSSVNFLPVPGSSGTVTVSGVAIGFMPTTPLTIPSETDLTVGALAALPGSDAPGTAPVLATPTSGNTSALFDTGSFASAVCGQANDGFPCQLYKFNVPADGDYNAEIDWSNLTDLGLYVLSADGTTDTGQACDQFGNQDDPNNIPGGTEACTVTLTAGDYQLAVVNFGPFYGPPPDPAPESITVKMTAP